MPNLIDLYNSLVPFLYTYQQNGYIEITIRHRVVYLEVRLVAVGPDLSIRDTAQIDVSIMPNLAYYTKHCTAASSFVDNSHYNKIMFLLPICKACITSMGNEKFIEWHCLSTTSGAYTLYTSGINSIGTTTKIKITPQSSNMETVSYTRAIQGYYEQ